MLRSGRLIIDDISEATREFNGEYEKKTNDELQTQYWLGNLIGVKTIQTELMKGDIMTGFEIIAGLPLETQQNIYIAETTIKLGNCAEKRSYVAVLDGVNIRLTGLYKWNGEKWEDKDNG